MPEFFENPVQLSVWSPVSETFITAIGYQDVLISLDSGTVMKTFDYLRECIDIITDKFDLYFGTGDKDYISTVPNELVKIHQIWCPIDLEEE